MSLVAIPRHFSIQLLEQNYNISKQRFPRCPEVQILYSDFIYQDTRLSLFQQIT